MLNQFLLLFIPAASSEVVVKCREPSCMTLIPRLQSCLLNDDSRTAGPYHSWVRKVFVFFHFVRARGPKWSLHLSLHVSRKMPTNSLSCRRHMVMPILASLFAIQLPTWTLCTGVPMDRVLFYHLFKRSATGFEWKKND